MRMNDITLYDKISDVVYRLGLNAVLKFNVSFSRTSKDGSRRFGYSEYIYKSSKCGENLISIKRDNDYYLSIESISAPSSISISEKIFIRIGITEMPKLITALQICADWFNTRGLFVMSNNELVVSDDSLNYAITGLPMNKYLLFTPTIIQTGGTSKFDRFPGLNMELGEKGKVVTMTIDNFLGFKYVIDNFNMYQSYNTMMLQLFGSYSTGIGENMRVDMVNQRRSVPYSK